MVWMVISVVSLALVGCGATGKQVHGTTHVRPIELTAQEANVVGEVEMNLVAIHPFQVESVQILRNSAHRKYFRILINGDMQRTPAAACAVAKATPGTKVTLYDYTQLVVIDKPYLQAWQGVTFTLHGNVEGAIKIITCD
jgi:hypothetical protein